ncbi:AMP-binding protein [Plantactinospora sp. KLBMP9567]|uniref:AMP-binding protein n=1 Tax=Plantactinospora sp. KLBMP9567 TaxID=3085900 RepID=UPI002981A7BD|nr:AMP-binding protein [Plantactinospora sp. KLBMP9567]MDW5329228.1 AMP-binding protein [Plantactinospora sp. KLBMP9567]
MGTRTLAEWFAHGLHGGHDRIALRIGRASWTYGELHDLALCWAGTLVRRSGGSPAAVGVLASRTIEAYAGILAALYAGAVVVPLHPGYPAERTAAMAREAGVGILIADGRGVTVAADGAGPLAGLPVLVPDPAVVAAGRPLLRPDPAAALADPVAVDPGGVAYVLFTSGSTGRPKGVPVTHANMDWFLEYNQARYGITPDDVLSQTFDITFDLVMFDLFMAWSAGATSVCTTPHAFANLPDFVRNHGLTVWFSVPSAVRLVHRAGGLSANSMPSLRWSLFCGEALTARDATDWQLASAGSVVENLYGPTELTLACTAYRWNPQRSPALCVNDVVPIGTVYPTMEGVLLGADGNLAADEGELCVTGPQMFPGYLDPADDAGRFLDHDDRRWYRTGDLVRRAGTAGLAYLGRIDQQIKMRGYRIEPSEIEAAARRELGVSDAVVVGFTTATGDVELALFYLGAPMARKQIIDGLRATLPDFMVPRRQWRLDEFPLNDNRKVDRRALVGLAEKLASDYPTAAGHGRYDVPNQDSRARAR